MPWPDDVGILHWEFYYPSFFVDQSELEEYDLARAKEEGREEWKRGKYTLGLGQSTLSFVKDNEDVHSLSLTVVSNLLENGNIDPKRIGRLEVGTETLLDKSKSVKSVIMQLFTQSGNHDIEGVDTTNACFGGTQALFNAINWVESSSWDGKEISLDSIEALVFHTPYCKLIQKAVARLVLSDIKRKSREPQSDLEKSILQRTEEWSIEAVWNDSKAWKSLYEISAQTFAHKTEPSLKFARQLGNIYTSSLYAALLSFLLSASHQDLTGKRIVLFSYGSGLASAMFAIRVKNMNTLRGLIDPLQTKLNGLGLRRKCSPKEFVTALNQREEAYCKVPVDPYPHEQRLDSATSGQSLAAYDAFVASYEPLASHDELWPGTYYLTRVDELYRREYTRLEPDTKKKVFVNRSD